MYIRMKIAGNKEPIVRPGELPRWCRAYNALLVQYTDRSFYKCNAAHWIASQLGCSVEQAKRAYEHLAAIGLIERAEY